MNKKERDELKNRRVVATQSMLSHIKTALGYAKELQQINLKLAGEKE